MQEEEISGEGIICLGRDSSGLHYLFMQEDDRRPMQRIWINFGFEFNMNNQLRVEKFFWAESSIFKNREGEYHLGLDLLEKKKVVDFYFFDCHGLLVEAVDLLNNKKGSSVELTQSNRPVSDLGISKSENKVFVAFDDGSLGIWEGRNMNLLEAKNEIEKQQTEKENKKEIESQENHEDISDAGLVLIDKKKVEEFNTMKRNYEKRIEELKVQMEIKILEEEDKTTKKLEKLEKELKGEITFKNNVIESIRKEKQEIENEITLQLQLS